MTQELLAQMVIDAYKTVVNCQYQAGQDTRVIVQKQSTSVSLAGPLKFLATKIMSPLLKTAFGQYYQIFLVDHYTKQRRAILFVIVRLISVATDFVYHWVISYSILRTLWPTTDSSWYQNSLQCSLSVGASGAWRWPSFVNKSMAKCNVSTKL